MHFLKDHIPDDPKILDVLHSREMRIENRINRFRVIFFAILILFDVGVNIKTGHIATSAAWIDLSTYLIPIGRIYFYTFLHP